MTIVRAHLIFALLGLALSLPAAAQWKWRDAEGKVQYSDRPPPAGVAEKDILQQPASATKRIQVISSTPLGGAAASAPVEAASRPRVESKADAELEARRRKAEQEQLAKARADEQKNAAIKSDNCNQARSYLRTLEDGMRVSRTNEKGEREILDDKQRAAEIQRARGVMNSDCAKQQ